MDKNLWYFSKNSGFQQVIQLVFHDYLQTQNNYF